MLSLGPLPDVVRLRLHDLFLLLDQDIDQLVQDAEPIRDIFKQIRGHLPTEVKDKLYLVAFIEGHQPRVEHAQNRLEERARQERLLLSRENFDSQIADLDTRIQILSSSHPDITANVDRLERKRAELLDELRRVDEELSSKKNKLADLPSTIIGMEHRKHAIAKKVQAIR